MADLMPVDLPGGTLTRLDNYVGQAATLEVSELRRRADEHLQRTQAAAQKNPLVDLGAARAIVDRIHALAEQWDQVPRHARQYCKGAILYFAAGDDEIGDLVSPIGFDDDIDVLNACLKLARRDDLCIDVNGLEG